MTGKKHLRRLDDQLAVANEHMARGNELWAENRDAFVDFRQASADLRQSIEDMRVELRQTSLRSQRVAEQFEAEVRLSRKQRVEERAKDRTVLHDLLAESRAGRDALFVILDEIRGRGQGPAAAGA